ncbi:MAG: hypothetical protein RLY49_504 [Candidatus Parcubacteria bacterium]|jgi:hypothetical protein
MPPRLDQPWDFGAWDHSETPVPPWSHRGFWYHDRGKSGDRLVVVWRWAFDERDQMFPSGDIYRCEDMLEAIKLWSHFRREIENHSPFTHDGAFIFFGTRRICEPSICGEPFPESLPNGRWL